MPTRRHTHPLHVSRERQFCSGDLYKTYAVACAVLRLIAALSAAVTATATVIPKWSEGQPVQVPLRGTAWLGSRTTATRTRSWLPITPLAGSKSTQPGPG